VAQEKGGGPAGPQDDEQYPAFGIEALDAVFKTLQRLAAKKPVGRPKGKTYDEKDLPAAATLRAELMPLVKHLARARNSGDIDGPELQRALADIIGRIAPNADAKREAAALARMFPPPESRRAENRRACRPPRYVVNQLVHLAFPDLPIRVIARLNPKS
jgi:hypothetical protein